MLLATEHVFRPVSSETVSSLRELPDTRLFWQWVGKATRPVIGWVLTGVGVLVIALGWWGVSGESLVAKQLPYLISGGIGGLVLVALGAMFLATEDLRRDSGRLDRLEQMVDELHAVLLSRADAPTPAGHADAQVLSPSPEAEAAPAATAPAATGPAATAPAATAPAFVRPDSSGGGAARELNGGGDLVALPSAQSFHRADCVMVEGKGNAQPVSPEVVTRRGLKPCRLCEPVLADS